MTRKIDFDKYDLNHIIIKPLYTGLVINILIPMAFLLICYYLDNNRSLYNRIGDSAYGLFIVLAVLSAAQTVYAILMRNKMMSTPMIKSEATFSADLTSSLIAKSKPVFIIIALIAFYGFVYYLLTARFQETVFLVFFSFVVFQFVRPRIAFVRKLIEKQTELVEKGQFLK